MQAAQGFPNLFDFGTPISRRVSQDRTLKRSLKPSEHQDWAHGSNQEGQRGEEKSVRPFGCVSLALSTTL